jgi:uridine kinase
MKVIGICGGSGSGKTTLLKRLAEHYQDYKPAVFSMDNYYKPIEEQEIDENGKVNFDLPTAINRENLETDLKQLFDGQSIEVVEYQFNAQRKHVLITVEPSEVLIIEGLFVFEYASVRSALDFGIFIEVDPAIQLDRRIYRDQESRDYDRKEVLYQWNNHVLPCFEKYLAPYKFTADFIYHNDSGIDDFDRLTEKLEPILPQKKH